MTDRITHFLAMGGYAVYVWPAYAVATTVLGVLIGQSVAAYRRARRALAAVERTRR